MNTIGDKMAQLDLFRNFGTDPRKLARTNDPDTSHEAAQAVDTTRLESLVWATILGFGAAGCISDDVRGVLKAFPYSSITARYKALGDKGFIEFNGERRKGLSGRSQRVMVAR